MGWDPGPRPEWVQEAIAGRFDAILGPAREPLDPVALSDEARVVCGLEDFGDGDYLEPLERLLSSAEAEAGLHVLGRWRLRETVLASLSARLKMRAYAARDPGVLDEAVTAPIIITGSPRSGTSILHQLLARDPALRAPSTWELWSPAPPPTPATWTSDARIALAGRIVRLGAALAPAFEGMHEMSGLMPRECIGAQNHSFRSDDFPGNFWLPGYQAWLDGCDMTPSYDWHRLSLQMLQRRMPGRTWVLKSPAHLAALDALFAAYPDAELVITHRDPLTMLASVVSLEATLYWAHGDGASYDQVVAAQVDRHGRLLDHLVEWRAAHPDRRVHDVDYWEFAADPVGTVAGLYRDLDRAFSDEARAAVPGHLAAPQGRAGGHRYAFDDLGLDQAETRARFRRYQDAFGVPDDF